MREELYWRMKWKRVLFLRIIIFDINCTSYLSSCSELVFDHNSAHAPSSHDYHRNHYFVNPSSAICSLKKRTVHQYTWSQKRQNHVRVIFMSMTPNVDINDWHSGVRCKVCHHHFHGNYSTIYHSPYWDTHIHVVLVLLEWHHLIQQRSSNMDAKSRFVGSPQRTRLPSVNRWLVFRCSWSFPISSRSLCPRNSRTDQRRKMRKYRKSERTLKMENWMMWLCSESYP